MASLKFCYCAFRVVIQILKVEVQIYFQNSYVEDSTFFLPLQCCQHHTQKISFFLDPLYFTLKLHILN